MTVQSVQAFLRNVRTAEMAEAFFSRLVIIVEGASEREALPLLCAALGLKFDSEDISVAASGGKTVIDTLVQLYQAHGIKTYVIFDNDKEKDADDRAYNKVICRVLKIAESNLPAAQISDQFAILDGNWEKQVEADLALIHPGLYPKLVAEARRALHIKGDKNKPLVAPTADLLTSTPPMLITSRKNRVVTQRTSQPGRHVCRSRSLSKFVNCAAMKDWHASQSDKL